MALANLTSSGSITTPDGDPWTQGADLAVGYSGTASMLLNDHIDGNGITGVSCGTAYVAYGPGVQASFTMSGSSCLFQWSRLWLGNGINSRGTFTMAGGALKIDLNYQNNYIYLGGSAGGYGRLILTDPGTTLHLSDFIIVGYLADSRGYLQVKNGALLESTSLWLGYHLGTVGTVVVDGPGTILRNWTNSDNQVGVNSRGYFIVQNGALAELYGLTLGWSNGSHGEVLVTGAGSRLENHYGNANIGRGAGSATGPGEGLVRLARGGVFYCDDGLRVGHSTYNPKGTMVFTIGDDGGGSIIPGRADVNGVLVLNVATLLMEVDTGHSLSLGQQFVLIDYDTLDPIRDRFMNVAEGGIILTPNHHAFRINYATDLGSGDLAITATVVAPPTTDTDTDNLLDAWEIRCFGSTDDPRAAPGGDPDGDGRTTANEHEAGTDPLDPNSRCQTSVQSAPVGTPWDLAYSPYDPTVTYTVERATSITGPWNEVTPTATTMDGDTIFFTLPADTADQAFYRVKIAR